MTLFAIADATKLVGLDDIIEVIALASHWVPQLETTIRFVSLPHNKHHIAVRHTSAKNNIGLKLAALLLIDVAEVIGKDDGMLLVIASTKVKEFLRCRPEIRQVLKHSQVFDIRDHRHKSGHTFDSILLIRILIKVDDCLRWFLRRDVTAKNDTLSSDIFAEQFDVRVLELASI